MKPASKIRPYLYLVLSAALSALSFAPWNIWPLGFVALWPVFYLLETEFLTLKRVFLWFIVWAIAINTFGYHWLVYTIEIYGHLPWFVTIPIFLLYAIATGTRFLIFLALNLWWRKKLAHQVPPSPWQFFIKSQVWRQTLFWGLGELISWQLFPWYGANLVSANLLFVQAADILGVRALSLLWFAISLGFYESLLSQMRGTKNILPKLLPALTLFLLLHGYGIVRYQLELERIHQADKIRIAVPQGNTPLSFSHLRNAREALYEAVSSMVNQTIRLIEKEHQGGRSVDLVVWPEGATPFLSLQRSSFLRSEVARLLKVTGIPLIINDILYDTHSDKVYSNMALLSKGGEVIESYQKVFLLPFGEFMPLGDIFPFLKNLIPEISDFSHGSRFVLFPYEEVQILPVICYEIIPSNFVRDFYNLTGKKANLIVNITNDAWFGDSVESYQHLALGRMRSIELRLPIVRATNSGVSALIDSAGRVSGETLLFQKAERVYEVPIVKQAPTLYAQWGEFGYYAMLIALLLVNSLPWFSKLKKHH